MLSNVRILNSAIDTDKIAEEAVIAADVASQALTGTVISTTDFMRVGRVNICPTTSSLVLFSSTTPVAPDIILVQVQGDTSGTMVNVVSSGTTGFNMRATVASTIDWVAILKLGT
jgi:hypothetical protein